MGTTGRYRAGKQKKTQVPQLIDIPARAIDDGAPNPFLQAQPSHKSSPDGSLGLAGRVNYDHIAGLGDRQGIEAILKVTP